MADNFEYFQISQAGVLIRENKCLIVHFSDIDFWDIPGGRLDKGEYGELAFKREIKEEIGFADFKNLGVVDYDIWYVKGTPVCAVANLIENDKDKIILSNEHDDYKWVAEQELDNYKFLWPNAKRMIKKAFVYKKLLEKNG